MLIQRTLFDLEDATSSVESLGGSLHSNSQDSQKTRQFGLEVVHASRTRLQGSAKEIQTKETCGQSGLTSFDGADLNTCLASKCQQLLGTDGSTDCATTWKQRTTPSGRLFWEHIPQDGITQGNDCTGVGRLPTPQCMDAKGYSQKLSGKYRKTGHLKHWVHGTLLAIHSATGVSSWPNPMLCEWLMGFPRLWISGQDYTPTETP